MLGFAPIVILEFVNSACREGETVMDSSEWTELAKITARLDELRKLLDAAEDTNQIAAFYALEAVITELEATRDRLLRGLVDRVVDQAAAYAVGSRDWQCLGL